MKALVKRGFTLVELMVVIAIVSLLAAALTVQVPKIRETGRAARCQANLRNLAMAAQSWSLKERDNWRSFPAAGSWESSHIALDGTGRGLIYWSGPGNEPDAWVSWTEGGGPGWPWRTSNRQSHWGRMRASRFDQTEGYISVTNGALWEYVGRDLSTYVCDSHKSAVVTATGMDKRKLYRSYVMNAYFGWDGGKGRKGIDAVSLSGTASLRLMFAEMPGLDKNGKASVDTSPPRIDSVLQYNNGDEVIGFNHRVGRRWAGHVAFADGHVEIITRPTDRQGEVDLTYDLCTAQEIRKTVRDKLQ
ncbi:MAG: type II secretion system GspH family protein [Kiritimatiellaeota bacterium]|nr:type II secretion system GspH family protein [Kiritimatiellota bacterium]